MRAVFAALIAVALAPGADRAANCKQATERYNRIQTEVQAAVELLATCVASSRGRDASVAELDELDEAEARLATIVGESRRLARGLPLYVWQTLSRTAVAQECFSQVFD